MQKLLLIGLCTLLPVLVLSLRCGDGIQDFGTLEQCDDGRPPQMHNLGFEASLEGWDWNTWGNARVGTGDVPDLVQYSINNWAIPQGSWAAKVHWKLPSTGNLTLLQNMVLPSNHAGVTMTLTYRLWFDTQTSNCVHPNNMYISLASSTSGVITSSVVAYTMPCGQYVSDTGAQSFSTDLTNAPDNLQLTFNWGETDLNSINDAYLIMDNIAFSGFPEDGCDYQCKVESGWTCSGFPSTCSPICGDGVVKTPEACDDGNQINNDGCDFGVTCAVSHGWVCNTTQSPSPCHEVCGNGLISINEQCDDGNSANGDGCSSTCRVETNWTCGAEPSICRDHFCGNGNQDGTEECDDGNKVDTDGCASWCSVVSGWSCHGFPSVCEEVCGNNITTLHEQCDDGNLNPNDGCDDCVKTQGYTCSGSPSVCVAVCGDGITIATEQCDDGNSASGDGCYNCAAESGWTCPANQPCKPICGDGVIKGAETCDDKNTNAGDGCSSTCQTEDGFSCAGAPSICSVSNIQNTPPAAAKKNKHVGLIVGLVVGLGVALIVAIIIIAVLIAKNRKKNKDTDEIGSNKHDNADRDRNHDKDTLPKSRGVEDSFTPVVIAAPVTQPPASDSSSSSSSSSSESDSEPDHSEKPDKIAALAPPVTSSDNKSSSESSSESEKEKNVAVVNKNQSDSESGSDSSSSVSSRSSKSSSASSKSSASSRSSASSKSSRSASSRSSKSSKASASYKSSSASESSSSSGSSSESD